MSQPRSEALSIEFSVADGLGATWDETRIGALVRSIIAREALENGGFAIALHLVGDDSIRALNAEHRGQDVHTDVLSFPLYDRNDSTFALPPGQATPLGDVVISYPRAVAQAYEFGHSVDRELAYLVAHGVLHILGYDHEKRPDRERMRQREEEVLQPLGFTR
jgi:probable rRNA maturation factor